MIRGKPHFIQKSRKRRKKGEITKLKEQLWQLCRQIVKKRYGNTCFTCGKIIPKGIHTGHFITSSTCSTEMRFSLDNLRPQCYHDNINLSGNWVEYEKRLIAEKGAEFVEQLKARNAETKGKTYTADWFRAKIQEYTNLL